MNQFDIFKNKNPQSSRDVPYLINLQSDPMAPLATRIVAPLRREIDYSRQKLSRIHLSIDIENTGYIIFISEMAAIPSDLLGEKVGSASSMRDMFTSAIDLLFTGF